MQRQKSFEDDGRGILYIVPTPIGNLEDMTFRALRMLEEADLILAEDTRHTQKLLHYFDIKNDLLSYHEHNQTQRTVQVIEKLQQGKVLALVSDAGMPAISDPGNDLVKEVIANDLRVTVLPGATAAINALVGSGLSTEEFLFYGFLPRKKQEKVSELTRLANYPATVILYESPYRVKETVQQIANILGSNRNIVIAREITKVHEEFIRGTAEAISKSFQDEAIKGECCIVIEGGTGVVADDLWWARLSIKEHVEYYETEENIAHKAAMKKVAVDRNLSRREVYDEIHVKRNE